VESAPTPLSVGLFEVPSSELPHPRRTAVKNRGAVRAKRMDIDFSSVGGVERTARGWG
jgi:hypothetical protein